MRWDTFFVAAIMVASASLSCEAQIRLDMNRVTCQNWLGLSPEDQEFVRFWMSGYYNAAANNNVLDYNRLQTNSAKVAAYCKRHKSDTLPTAIKKSAS